MVPIKMPLHLYGCIPVVMVLQHHAYALSHALLSQTNTAINKYIKKFKTIRLLASCYGDWQLSAELSNGWLVD